MKNPNLIYGVDDLPSFPKLMIYGIQWAIVILPTLTIISNIASASLGLEDAFQVAFLQKLMLTTGGVLILQTLAGHRYPLLDGPASALLLSFIILAPQGIDVIRGGILGGGLLLALMGGFRLIHKIQALFTDNVVGVILILIAITILPYIAPMVIGQGPENPSGRVDIFCVSILVMLSIAMMSHWFHGFFKTIPVFLGVIFGTVVMWALGEVNGSGIGACPWFTIPEGLFPGPPKWSLSAVFTMAVAYIAVMINGVGSIYSIGEVVGTEGMNKRIDRGIAATGIGGAAAGLIGAIGTVSYAYSPGVVLVTRVGSRYTITVCGAILVAMAFFQKIMAVMTAVPSSVVSAALVTGMAAQVGAGISVLTRSGKSLDGRDYLVIGIPMLLGGIVSILPDAFFDLFGSPMLKALIKNGLIVGIVSVLILEHVLLPKRKNRA